ncbi:hypothetical protein ACFY00_30160 [Kitasatospora sp. NPDC001540]|uniref:hypothetical protein n=1 Tax=Kitasatospora sp. NPDC001540 TaxID=3364014 RepID=UPI0036737AD3
MDAELQKAVTGLDETREKLRGEVTAPLRAGRGRFPETDEHLLLGALAGVVESLQELADIALERRNANWHAWSAHTHLKDAASLLRDGEQRAGRNA